MLEGIGEDPDREGLRETPERIARMCEELFAGREADGQEELSKVFAAEGSQMVLEKDIPFYSMCEHHMLPFYGKAHVAYLPEGRVVALIVPGPCKFFGLFGRGEEFYIPWECIKQIGDDIILIDKPVERRPPYQGKKPKRRGGFF